MMMLDGVFNGYLIVNFDGQEYCVEFYVVGCFVDYQMCIIFFNEMSVEEFELIVVYVNVFNGLECLKVEMKINGVIEWIVMMKIMEIDFYYVEFVVCENVVLNKIW